MNKTSVTRAFSLVTFRLWDEQTGQPESACDWSVPTWISALKLVTKNETVPLTKKEATINASKMYNPAWVTNAIETGYGPKPSGPKETQKTTDMWKTLVRWEAPKKKPAAKPAAKTAAKPAAKTAAPITHAKSKGKKNLLRLHGPGTVSPNIGARSPKRGGKRKMVSEKDSEEAEESDEETQAEPKLQTKQVKLLADALIRKMGNPSGLSKELKQLHEKVLEQSQASGTKEREHAHAILELAQASGAKELIDKHAHAILEQAQAIATSERAQAMESASSERAQAARQTDMTGR